MNKPITWFEIPTKDLDRAKAFYESVFNLQLKKETFGGTTLVVFPYDRDTAVGGALVEGLKPGFGTVPYLNAGEDLDCTLERALAGGARMELGKTALPPGMGFYAQIQDLDGNLIGLHGTK